MSMDDFYEDDEPVEKIVEAFERAPRGVTARPRWTYTHSAESVVFANNRIQKGAA